MAGIPQPPVTTVAAVFAAIAAAEPDERRPHLGASLLGRECARELWYVFRWCDAPEREGRVLRLFRRGRLEENQLAADLTAAGVTVVTHDDHGEQYRWSDVGGHVGGSMDGAALGLLEAPKTWHVLEFKTHNAKSFARLLAEGLAKAKPEHWAQVQLYMHWSGMRRAYYLAVNKDTDELLGERVRYDAEAAQALVAKGRDVVTATLPLPRLSERPEYYVCKFCRARTVCHEGALPAPSCRTCVHATPELDGAGRWSCARHARDLTPADQRAGCADHVYLPPLVPGQQVDASAAENWIAYTLPDGRPVRNGTACSGERPIYASHELHAAQAGGFALLADPNVQVLRNRFDGRIHAAPQPA